jgi:hypothetical protein
LIVDRRLAEKIEVVTNYNLSLLSAKLPPAGRETSRSLTFCGFFGSPGGAEYL